MKKTLLLLALGISTICMTSCSRSYGCPYGLGSTIEKAEQKEIKSTDAQLILKENETSESESFAD